MTEGLLFWLTVHKIHTIIIHYSFGNVKRRWRDSKKQNKVIRTICAMPKPSPMGEGVTVR